MFLSGFCAVSEHRNAANAMRYQIHICISSVAPPKYLLQLTCPNQDQIESLVVTAFKILLLTNMPGSFPSFSFYMISDTALLRYRAGCLLLWGGSACLPRCLTPPIHHPPSERPEVRVESLILFRMATRPTAWNLPLRGISCLPLLF